MRPLRRAHRARIHVAARSPRRRSWLARPVPPEMQRTRWLEAMVRSQNGNGHRADLEEQPYKWSQRWSEDPPSSTTVNVGNGFVEVYLGKRGLADGQRAQRGLLIVVHALRVYLEQTRPRLRES